jgi:hypothetical protein
MKAGWITAIFTVLLWLVQSAFAHAEGGGAKIKVNSDAVEAGVFLSEGTVYAEARLLIALQGGTQWLEGNVYVFEIGKHQVMSGTESIALEHAPKIFAGKPYLKAGVPRGWNVVHGWK